MGQWEKGSRGGGRRENGKKAEAGRTSKLPGPREPVSLATMPAGGQRKHGGWRGACDGKGDSKSHRDLVGGGKGGRAALGSYRQSGGANGTRKTWGALVGETGRSHLTSTASLGGLG